MKPTLPSLVKTPLVVVSAVFPLFSFLSIYLRYAARRQSQQPIHSEDKWIGILTFALSSHVWIFADLTGVDHLKIDPASGITNSLMWFLLASALVQLPLSAVKVSILLFYKRIFGIGRFKEVVWFAIALVVCWTFIFFFLVPFQSDPFETSWKGGGRLRFDSAKLGLAQVGSSIALDVMVLRFPLPVISRLQLQTKKKWTVGVIFWLGSFCVLQN